MPIAAGRTGAAAGGHRAAAGNGRKRSSPAGPAIACGMPEKVHPLSAGIKGGIVGGLVMPHAGTELWRVERARRCGIR